MSTIASARLGLSGSLPMRAARVPADVLSGGGVGWLLLVAMHRLGVTLPALVTGTSLGFAIATGARQYLDGWPFGIQGYAQAALLGAIDGSFLYLGIRAVQRFRRLSTESVARKPPSGG